MFMQVTRARDKIVRMGREADGARIHIRYAISCLISCIVVELTSIGCTVPYAGKDTGSVSPLPAVVLLSVAVAGQLGQALSRCCINYVTRTSRMKASCADGVFTKVLMYMIGILSIPSLGPLQLAAAMLITVCVANSENGNDQGYGSAIIGLNFAATILAAAFGIFFYIPVKKDKHSNFNNHPSD